MKKTLLIFTIVLSALSLFAQEPAPKNTNVPGEVHDWQFTLTTNIVGVEHTVDANTKTSIGFPLTSTSLSAGYEISEQVWLIAKFHLYMELDGGDETGFFTLGPGIRADFIRTDHISFFGGIFASLGSEGKKFLFAPEVFFGVEYNLNSYLALGVFSDFTYTLCVFTTNTHILNFILGPNLTIYF
ncbi:MAG TPA: hypothetical protein VLJ60_00190 [bacterium]|nr:hypothetical protein [bacterium]